ncbi:MAG: A/G-specific adenine glycosylase [Candidatus Yonathbacteria bacterium]|nr:A/G-specific adenine glycosylase [Candidatus Yonathbacteria bacterium]
MQRKDIAVFQKKIWVFYKKEGRHNLPWRKTKDSYKILISEVMLQQTQVGRVLEEYPQFLKVFPNIEALADASFADILKTWQGMGYNRRALALHRLAKEIVEKYGGKVPHTRAELETLPGIGPYTAGAILAFAFNKPEIFIETNIRRVFIHHFFPRPALSKIPKGGARGYQPGGSTSKLVRDREILSLVEQTLDTKNPREWYWALIDYGAQLPKIEKINPNKRSKHYTKQSSFKGSLRELRGKIIRTLSKQPATFLALKSVSDNDPRTKEALDALIKDKLIKYEKRKYQIA